jgi:purine-nucleoside phosphorylase
MEGEYERAQSALKAILSKLPEEHQKPRVAIICGTGLGGIAEVLEPKTLIEIPYEDIPHFRVSTGEY